MEQKIMTNKELAKVISASVNELRIEAGSGIVGNRATLVGFLRMKHCPYFNKVISIMLKGNILIYANDKKELKFANPDRPVSHEIFLKVRESSSQKDISVTEKKEFDYAPYRQFVAELLNDLYCALHEDDGIKSTDVTELMCNLESKNDRHLINKLYSFLLAYRRAKICLDNITLKFKL